MSFTVSLRGYPEALLAADTITLDLPVTTTAKSLALSLARSSTRLSRALLHQDGTPRQTTKILVNGKSVAPDTPVRGHDAVTVLASLPCDG